MRERGCVSTFLQIHGKEVQLLHPFLQLVLRGGRHGVDVIVAAVVVLIGVGGEDLHAQGSKVTPLVKERLLQQKPIPFPMCQRNPNKKVNCRRARGNIQLTFISTASVAIRIKTSNNGKENLPLNKTSSLWGLGGGDPPADGPLRRSDRGGERGRQRKPGRYSVHAEDAERLNSRNTGCQMLKVKIGRICFVMMADSRRPLFRWVKVGTLNLFVLLSVSFQINESLWFILYNCNILTFSRPLVCCPSPP